MTDYICTGGCDDVANNPGTRQTEGCNRYHEPLVPCNCIDGKHEEAVEEELASSPMDEEREA